MSLNINKGNWTNVKLGDVVTKREENDKTNVKNRFDRFLKVVHFDKETLHIKRWSSQEAGDVLNPTFWKVFRKGQILFPTRNPHLRRTGLASFDGICGEKTLTLQPNIDFLIPEFIPFLFHSESFYAHTTAAIVGSTNPHVRWRDVSKYEFLLPPKDQQAQLAKLLWAMDEVIEKEKEVLEKLKNCKNAIFDNLTYKNTKAIDKYFGRKKSKHGVVKLGELLTQIQYGISESLELNGEIPILRMNNLQEGKLDLNDLKFYNPNDGELDKFLLDKGDVLFNRTNSFDLVGKVSLFQSDGVFSFASYLIRLKADSSKLDSRFLNFYLNTPVGLAKIRKYRTPGVSQSNINAQNLKYIPIPYPSLIEQNVIMDKVQQIEENETLLDSKISFSQSLQKSLINQIFG